MLPTPFTVSADKRQNRSLIQYVTPFLQNIIFQYTNPVPFETEPHILHTIPLIREHCDSYLYYIQYKTLDITPSQTPFQVIFNPVKGINSGTFYRTIHPQNITLSIQDVFRTYMQKLIEFNEHQDIPPYRPSHLQELKRLSEYFEVPDLDTKVQRHDNPHYWLQRDILQIKQFEFKIFTKITLTDDTIPQVKIFTHFLLKFFRFNYQLLWEQKDQNAYTNFPKALTDIELLPYIIDNKNKHLHYIDLTSLKVTYFEQINLDHNFVLEHSETSDSKPYITSDTLHQTTLPTQTFNVGPPYIRQQSEQSEQIPFQVIFNPVKGINSGTFYRTIHPQNITLSIQDVFRTYMQKLIEFNEHQDIPPYRPSHLQELKRLSEYFEVPDLDTKVQRHDNPHYWLQRDILQIKQFEFKIFTKITLTDDTIPQVKIFTHFLLKFFRFNYQLLWEQKDQNAYTNFPKALTDIELLPYIIDNKNKHLHYIDLTSLKVTYFEQINLDHNFVLEHSETSDSKPYITSDTLHQTTLPTQTFNVGPPYIRQQSEQSEQESITQE